MSSFDLNKFLQKYTLTMDVDCWKHKQSGKHILKHDAIEKIAHQEGIKLVSIKTLNSDVDFVRFLVTMKKGEEQITTVGEAFKGNCTSNYYGCMAEKRGYDRAVLKLIHAYEHGISSEEEADDYSNKRANPSTSEVVPSGADSPPAPDPLSWRTQSFPRKDSKTSVADASNRDLNAFIKDKSGNKLSIEDVKNGKVPKYSLRACKLALLELQHREGENEKSK